MKFLDLFAGIGGFRLGMEMAGHQCVGWCEIDKYARKSYIAMHNPKGDEWFAEDIKKVQPNEVPKADVWCFGFPCQDISIAGKQRGLTGERSGLFYTVIDLIKSKKEEDKPSILFIENVKNLLSINGGWDFATILFELDEAGYDAEWQIINSSWFVPQNRERIFIIGHLRGKSARKVLPISGSNSKTLKQLIGGQQGMRVYDSKGISCTISSEGGGWGAKTGLYLINNRIRRLTPKECFRLQGFPDEYFHKAQKVNSDTQLYKQAGNSVTVSVIYEIAKRL
jgi:DNA (cytosine-5)-methyltransferase 1